MSDFGYKVVQFVFEKLYFVIYSMKTLVLGASENPERYAHKATMRLLEAGHEVVLVGKAEGEVAGNVISKNLPAQDEINTITLYLTPQNQKMWYEGILKLNPKRLIFNPNTENEELAYLAQEAGIEVIEACTLVMLATKQY